MPYNELERKLFLEQKGTEYFIKGDINRAFTQAFIKIMERNLNYNTIHDLYDYGTALETFPELLDVFSRFSQKYPLVDNPMIETAYKIAYLEFYRRIASIYEDGKAKINGDVYNELEKKIKNKLERDAANINRMWR